ncbi:hypothetical protein G9A89_016528 [Geosiphon pyriformis]|nr:hypothetical protein G9A89_016528 [Geosiphon pyriformis]
MSDDNVVLEFLSCVDIRFNHLPLLKSHALEMQCFNSIKSITLDIELSAVFGKLFPGIIRLSFMLESSLNKAKVLVISNKILVNNDLRKINSQSNREVIVKEIPVDFFRSIVESVFSKFGKIISIKIQLIGLWQKALVEFELSEVASLVASKWSVFMRKNSVHVALANKDKQTLLYTLPVGIMAHNLFGLVGAYDGKTCFISCNPDEASKLAAICSVLVFKDISLHWASLSLACCAKCKQFGHIFDVCLVVTNWDQVYLANIYKKKQALIACPVSFGKKTWAQITRGSSLHVVPLAALGVGSVSDANSPSLASTFLVVSGLNNHLAFLERSLEILSDQVSGILKKLSFVELVFLAPLFCVSSLAVSVLMAPVLDSNMVLDGMLASSPFFLPNVGELVVGFSSSSSKILTSKVGGLESKISALEVSVSSVLAKLDLLCSVSKTKGHCLLDLESGNMVSFLTKTKLRVSAGFWIKDKFEGVRIFMSGLEEGFLGMDVAVVMDGSLAWHVLKVKENKLLVTFLDLYAGVFAKTHFAQALSINSLISKMVNCSSFVVIGRDFNENSARKCASFRKCSDLGLVNLLDGVEKTIDYVFVSKILSLAVVGHSIVSVSEFFDTDHDMIDILVGLKGLVDACLNSICKQANKDHWKYKIKDVDAVKWNCFRDCFLVKLFELSDTFLVSKEGENLDGMWEILRSAVYNLADKTFSKHWFCKFDGPKNKQSLRFFKLKSLVAKITKSLCSGRLVEVEHFVQAWSALDAVNASEVAILLENGSKLHELYSLLLKVKKCYQKSKYHETKLARCKHIRDAIDKHIENFNSNKGKMIRSVLECPFHKIVLDYLVVDDELILDLMERRILSALSGLWTHQYASLDHVNDNAFLGVISDISLSELSLVISGLFNSKAAGLSGITNELWKHSSADVLACLLDLLNSCLRASDVPGLPIALIKMVKKILSKILLDWIFLVCSEFDVFYGDNFSVLRSTSTQSPVFAIGLIVEDVLEKGRKIWLVLQNMHKAYDSVGWHHLRSSLKHIKMYSRFIEFFGNIHKNRINKIMTDFGLSNSYVVYDVKRQKHLCGYRINSSFVVKSGRVESSGGMSFFFATSAFVDNTIWIGLRTKAFLPKDFPSKALHYLFLYSLKPFEQVQAEAKIASVIGFSNAPGILGHMFEHCALNLQVLSWTSLNSLCHLVKLRVCLLNNFLAGVVRIFLDTGVFLDNKLSCAFHKPEHFPMSDILGALCYFDVVRLLKCFGIAFGDCLLTKQDQVIDWKTFHCWKRLSPRGLVPVWFNKAFVYMCNSLVDLNNSEVLDSSGLFCSSDFLVVCKYLHKIWTGELNIFTNSSLSGLGTLSVACGAAAYFSKINIGVGVKVQGLLSSMLAKLQAIAVALECVSLSCSVVIHSDSQAALDVCVSEYELSRRLAVLHIYLIKAVHNRLPVAVCKRLYNIGYLSVLCLMCSDVEFSDHVFMCSANSLLHSKVMTDHIELWKSLVGVHFPASFSVLNTLANTLDVSIYAVLCKSFVFQDWIGKAVSIFGDGKKAQSIVVKFVCHLVDDHHDHLWLLRSKFRVDIEKIGLICNDGGNFALSQGLPRLLSDGVVHMLDVVKSFAITVDFVIAVMKKTIKASGSEGGFKAVVSRKKRKGSVLEESIDNKGVAAKALGAHSWSSKTGDTMESESIDMEEECLVEETSGLYVKTKKVLRKPLGVIDYDTVNVENDVLDDFLLLPPPLPVKPSIQVPVRKSFTLDIDLVVKKVNFVRKIFLGINSFGGASTLSKFGGIIRTSFISEKAMMTAVQLANDYSIVVNTDLKCPINNCMNWAIVLKKISVGTSIKAADLLAAKWFILIGKDTVRVVQADVDKQTWNARDEFRALLYTFPMGINTHDLWDFIGLVSGKTCVIKHSSVNYVQTHCATVCFDSEGSLIQTMANTLVIKGDQFHLAKIYEKKSASVFCPLAFGKKTWASVIGKPLPLVSFGGSAQSGSISYGKPLLTVNGELEDHLKNIESSFVSLAEQISELAKRLDSFMPAVSQPSPGCQLPVTSLLQNQGKDIVMGMGSGDATSDKTAAILGSTASPEVMKLENMLEGLSALVMSLSVHLDGLALAGGAFPLPLFQ